MSTAFSVTKSAAPRSEADRAAQMSSPKFGTVFSDHMVRIEHTAESGWHEHAVVPYGPLMLDPAAAVFHYGQEIFEGLKLYRHADGSIWAFRPEANARRFAASARRLALPELSEEDFLASIKELVAVDGAWVPTPSSPSDEASLYLRPFMFASEAFLGVRPASGVTYLLIASPTGPYFSGGIKPVSIWVSEHYNRSGPGGTGAAKCGGNYAASLLPQTEGQQHGCDQVCFLDAATGTYLEELGGMNVFIVKADGEVVTPALSGSILEGVTRDSILQLLNDDGHKVTERKITLAELLEGIADGAIAEVFACGTAAVVTPIGRIAGAEFDLKVGGGEPGEVTMSIREQLLDVQYGRAEDTHGWMRQLA